MNIILSIFLLMTNPLFAKEARIQPLRLITDNEFIFQVRGSSLLDYIDSKGELIATVDLNSNVRFLLFIEENIISVQTGKESINIKFTDKGITILDRRTPNIIQGVHLNWIYVFKDKVEVLIEYNLASLRVDIKYSETEGFSSESSIEEYKNRRSDFTNLVSYDMKNQTLYCIIPNSDRFVKVPFTNKKSRLDYFSNHSRVSVIDGAAWFYDNKKNVSLLFLRGRETKNRFDVFAFPEGVPNADKIAGGMGVYTKDWVDYGLRIGQSQYLPESIHDSNVYINGSVVDRIKF